MSDLCNAGENAAANALTDEPWIKLHTGAPGETAASNAFGDTTRVKIKLTAASGGVRSNEAEAKFEEVSAAGTVTHISAWTEESVGEPEWTAALAEGRALKEGDTLIFKAGEIDFTLA